jgi:poly(hydroxyalkanoate) granule-associated protein
MKTITEENKMNYLKNVGDQVYCAGRTLYFAGLGAAAIGGDQTIKVFNGLVEKGRTLQEKRETKAATSGTLKTKIKGLGKSAGKRIQNGLNGTLDRLGIPNREEIRDLTHSVQQLTEKVAALQPKLAD